MDGIAALIAPVVDGDGTGDRRHDTSAGAIDYVAVPRRGGTMTHDEVDEPQTMISAGSRTKGG